MKILGSSQNLPKIPFIGVLSTYRKEVVIPLRIAGN